MKQLSIETPFGLFYLGAIGSGLSWASFREPRDTSRPKLSPADEICAEAHLAKAREQFAEYFVGDLKEFDLAIAPGGTPFQHQVWEELRRIPYGQTITYRELANRIGKPKACRAVGAANGRNPLCVLVPCHRVVATDGTLGGYAGGLEFKTNLLRLENPARA